jgi:hypothetical protein
MEKFVSKYADENVAVTFGTAVWALFAFATESNSHAVIDTGRDGDVQFHFLANPALSTALVARVNNDLTGASANGTGRLDSQNSSRLKDLAPTTALLTVFGFASWPASGAFTSLARVFAFELQRFVNTTRRFFKGERDVSANVASTACAAASTAKQVAEHSATATEHFAKRGKNIFGRSKVAGAINSGVSVTIVAGSFLGVAQDFVGLSSQFEVLTRFIIARITVGMKLHRELAIGFGNIAI